MAETASNLSRLDGTNYGNRIEAEKKVSPSPALNSPEAKQIESLEQELLKKIWKTKRVNLQMYIGYMKSLTK